MIEYADIERKGTTRRTRNVNHDCPITDSEMLILSVTLDKKTHRVSVYAPFELMKDSEV